MACRPCALVTVRLRRRSLRGYKRIALELVQVLVGLHPEAVHVPLQVILAHLQQVGRDAARLFADLARGDRGSRTTDRRAARGVGAQAVGSGVGVAFLDLNVLGRNSELAGDDLGVGGEVALALATAALCAATAFLWLVAAAAGS